MAYPDDRALPHRPPRQPDTVRGRDRAAAELEDQVVEAMFTIGLHLHGTAALTADPLVRRRVEKATGDLDDVIRIIRDAAFGLGHRRTDRRLRTGIVHLHEDPPRPASPSADR